MAEVCDGLLAKLNELMDFLQFAKLPTADFHGVVTFMFREVNAPKDSFVCIRTIDMRRGIEIDNTTLHPQDPFLSDVVVVYVSLADFLYMYSGEATATEIAGMVMSGRVSVTWSAYKKLKAFADCFDFSSEKWDEYYGYLLANGVENKSTECSQGCCVSSTKEEIDANWLLVTEATTTTAVGQGGEWEVVTDNSVSKEPTNNGNNTTQRPIFGIPQIDDWLAKVWAGLTSKDRHHNRQSLPKEKLTA